MPGMYQIVYVGHELTLAGESGLARNDHDHEGNAYESYVLVQFDNLELGEYAHGWHVVKREYVRIIKEY